MVKTKYGSRRGFLLLIFLVIFLPFGQMLYPGGEKEKPPPVQKEDQVVEFSIRVVAPETFNDIPVNVNLTYIKPGEELKLPGEELKLPGDGFRFLFNLDIYGVKDNKRIALGTDGFEPKITVYISDSQAKARGALDLFYWDPYAGNWIKHDILRKDTVDPIQYDKKTGEFYFAIYKWPLDDRMCGAS